MMKLAIVFVCVCVFASTLYSGTVNVGYISATDNDVLYAYTYTMVVEMDPMPPHYVEARIEGEPMVEVAGEPEYQNVATLENDQHIVSQGYPWRVYRYEGVDPITGFVEFVSSGSTPAVE